MQTSQADQLLETFKIATSLLSPQTAKKITKHKSDPSPLKKKEIDILRLRILPVADEIMPRSFWNGTWCFYEVGIGTYGGGLDLGRVGFVQFHSQKVCGADFYTAEVLNILNKASASRADFTLAKPNEVEGVLGVHRHYKASPAQKFFSPELAAADLAWLIENTFSKFQQVKSI